MEPGQFRAKMSCLVNVLRCTVLRVRELKPISQRLFSTRISNV